MFPSIPQPLHLWPVGACEDILDGQAAHSLLFAQANSVGFYQLSKICVTPAVLVFDALTTAKYPTRKEVAAISILCFGVILATLTDHSVTTNLPGLVVALAAISFTAVYQVHPLLPSSENTADTFLGP